MQCPTPPPPPVKHPFQRETWDPRGYASLWWKAEERRKKEYLRRHDLHTVIGCLLDRCLEERPEQPTLFITHHLLQHSLGISKHPESTARTASLLNKVKELEKQLHSVKGERSRPALVAERRPSPPGIMLTRRKEVPEATEVSSKLLDMPSESLEAIQSWGMDVRRYQAEVCGGVADELGRSLPRDVGVQIARLVLAGVVAVHRADCLGSELSVLRKPGIVESIGAAFLKCANRVAGTPLDNTVWRTFWCKATQQSPLTPHTLTSEEHPTPSEWSRVRDLLPQAVSEALHNVKGSSTGAPSLTRSVQHHLDNPTNSLVSDPASYHPLRTIDDFRGFTTHLIDALSAQHVSPQALCLLRESLCRFVECGLATQMSEGLSPSGVETLGSSISDWFEASALVPGDKAPAAVAASLVILTFSMDAGTHVSSKAWSKLAGFEPLTPFLSTALLDEPEKATVESTISQDYGPFSKEEVEVLDLSWRRVRGRGTLASDLLVEAYLRNPCLLSPREWSSESTGRKIIRVVGNVMRCLKYFSTQMCPLLAEYNFAILKSSVTHQHLVTMAKAFLHIMCTKDPGASAETSAAWKHFSSYLLAQKEEYIHLPRENEVQEAKQLWVSVDQQQFTAQVVDKWHKDFGAKLGVQKESFRKILHMSFDAVVWSGESRGDVIGLLHSVAQRHVKSYRATPQAFHALQAAVTAAIEELPDVTEAMKQGFLAMYKCAEVGLQTRPYQLVEISPEAAKDRLVLVATWKKLAPFKFTVAATFMSYFTGAFPSVKTLWQHIPSHQQKWRFHFLIEHLWIPAQPCETHYRMMGERWGIEGITVNMMKVIPDCAISAISDYQELSQEELDLWSNALQSAASHMIAAATLFSSTTSPVTQHDISLVQSSFSGNERLYTVTEIAQHLDHNCTIDLALLTYVLKGFRHKSGSFAVPSAVHCSRNWVSIQALCLVMEQKADKRMSQECAVAWRRFFRQRVLPLIEHKSEASSTTTAPFTAAAAQQVHESWSTLCRVASGHRLETLLHEALQKYPVARETFSRMERWGMLVELVDLIAANSLSWDDHQQWLAPFVLVHFSALPQDREKAMLVYDSVVLALLQVMRQLTSGSIRKSVREAWEDLMGYYMKSLIDLCQKETEKRERIAFLATQEKASNLLVDPVKAKKMGVDIEVVRASHLPLLHSSWAVLNKQLITTKLFDTLKAISPTTFSLLQPAMSSGLPVKLVRFLDDIISEQCREALPTFLPRVRQIANIHAHMGVRAVHYSYFGMALLGTICELLEFSPVPFTPELKDAWLALYTSLSKSFIVLQDEADASEGSDHSKDLAEFAQNLSYTPLDQWQDLERTVTDAVCERFQDKVHPRHITKFINAVREVLFTMKAKSSLVHVCLALHVAMTDETMLKHSDEVADAFLLEMAKHSEELFAWLLSVWGPLQTACMGCKVHDESSEVTQQDSEQLPTSKQSSEDLSTWKLPPEIPLTLVHPLHMVDSPPPEYYEGAGFSVDGYIEHEILAAVQTTADTFRLVIALAGDEKDVKEEFPRFPVVSHLSIKVPPNQYFVLPQYRSYTPICEDKNSFTLLIKSYGEGTVSSIITSSAVGSRLLIRGPLNGPFRYRCLHSCKSLLLIGAGSGITPLYQILRHVLVDENSTVNRILLLYSNKKRSSILLAEELKFLSSMFSKKLKVVHFITQERFHDANSDSHSLLWPVVWGPLQPIDVEYDYRRVSSNGINQWCEACEIASDATSVICGPEEFNEAMTKAVRDAGLEQDRIHTL